MMQNFPSLRFLPPTPISQDSHSEVDSISKKRIEPHKLISDHEVDLNGTMCLKKRTSTYQNIYILCKTDPSHIVSYLVPITLSGVVRHLFYE